MFIFLKCTCKWKNNDNIDKKGILQYFVEKVGIE